jgi:hypothetical protein
MTCFTAWDKFGEHELEKLHTRYWNYMMGYTLLFIMLGAFKVFSGMYCTVSTVLRHMSPIFTCEG